MFFSEKRLSLSLWPGPRPSFFTSPVSGGVLCDSALSSQSTHVSRGPQLSSASTAPVSEDPILCTPHSCVSSSLTRPVQGLSGHLLSLLCRDHERIPGGAEHVAAGMASSIASPTASPELYLLERRASPTRWPSQKPESHPTSMSAQVSRVFLSVFVGSGCQSEV